MLTSKCTNAKWHINQMAIRDTQHSDAAIRNRYLKLLQGITDPYVKVSINTWYRKYATRMDICAGPKLARYHAICAIISALITPELIWDVYDFHKMVLRLNKYIIHDEKRTFHLPVYNRGAGTKKT